jgi:uncharacterized phage-like protein YoqJ
MPCGYDEDHPWAIRIKQDLDAWLTFYRPDVVISGLSQGWDTWLAEAAIGNGIELHGYCPYPRYRKKWDIGYHIRVGEIMQKCTKLIFAKDRFSKASYQKRNQMMVNDSDHMLVLWSGRSGGTKNTLDYAEINFTNFWIGDPEPETLF